MTATTPLKNERGLALILALLIVALLVAVVVEFDLATRTDLRAAMTFRDGTKAYQLARAGVEAGRALLAEDAKQSPLYDGLDELWATPVPAYPAGDGQVSLSIEDESGKINLNALAGEERRLRLQRLLSVLELDEALADPIVDWLDKDDTPESQGAEEAYYQSLSPPYHCKNGPMATLQELHQIKGITDEIYRKISPFLTLDSGSQQININTASLEVLQTLYDKDYTAQQTIPFPVSKEMAERIVEARPIDSCADLVRVPGVGEVRNRIGSGCTIKSGAFTIESTGEVSGIRKTIRATVRRGGTRTDLTAWRLL